MSVFEFGENNKLSLVALIAKANAIDKNSNKEQIFDTFETLTRRLLLEEFQIMSTIKIKLIDNIMKNAPHLIIRPISDIGVSDIAISKPLVVIIDTSGSMSNIIIGLQAKLKMWIDSRIADMTYNSTTFIFFDSAVHGPFYSTECLNLRHGSGSTTVIPALQVLKHVLNAKTENSDVIFITDGNFDEGTTAYNFGVLNNIENFVMIFPSHTPHGTAIDHYAYLPKITQPNTPIYSENLQIGDNFNALLNNKLETSYKVNIKKTLYTPICGEYLMMSGLSLFQMNSIVNSILNYPQENSNIVHNFFSYIMGVYNAIGTKGGDLLNTLRSDEMKLLWQLLQPLKKTLLQVPPSNIHYPTTLLVYDFLEAYEGEIVSKRDARINELKKRGNNKEILDEIANIKKSFECMKRVDEYERIMLDIEKLHNMGYSSIYVKYNYRAQISSDAFKGFPNLSRTDLCEIYKMIASIGITNKIDSDAIELVLDSHFNGLILVLRLISYLKTDNDKITLTATLVSRILFGFFATQITKGYSHTDDHNEIKILLWKCVTNFLSSAILFNVTNMKETVNCSPEWIKILHVLSVQTNIKVTKQPPDTTVWKLTNENCWKLNSDVLNNIATRNTALFVYRSIQSFGDENLTYVTSTHKIEINDFTLDTFILKVSGVEQTWQEWRDLPIKHLQFSNGESIVVTNGMTLQEKLTLNVNEFLEKYFEKGHRLINKAGKSHPISSYQSGIIRQTVQNWFLLTWKELCNCYKEEFSHLSKYSLPTVTDDYEFQNVKNLLNLALSLTPITYETTKLTCVPAWLIAKNTKIFNDEIINIVANISQDQSFSKLTGENQIKTIQSTNFEQLELACDIPEIIKKSEELASKLTAKFQPLELVHGVGKLRSNKKDAKTITSILELSDFNLDDFINLKIESLLSISDFYCSITGELFSEPVMFDGHIYEKCALLEWFKTSRTSPLTRRSHDDSGLLLEIEAPPLSFISALSKIKNKK